MSLFVQGGIDNQNKPRLCWRNYVSPATVTTFADTTMLENLANPATAYYTRFNTVNTMNIEIDIGNARVDYVGIARHSLPSTAQIKITAQLNSAEVTIIDFTEVGDGKVFLAIFDEIEPDWVRVYVADQGAPFTIGVLYCGISTVLERRMYVGHTPITMGKNTRRSGNTSESGQYLGEVTRRTYYTTTIELQNLTPEFMRDELQPYFFSPTRPPAFWAWRPGTYENEVGYV